MAMRDEILEQPTVVRRILDTQLENVERVAAAVRARDVEFVYLAARGTSDHAGIYAQYVLGMLLGLPVALAAPSLVSVYATPPRLGRALVVGISQSGRSPDVVSVIAEGRRQGAPTIALTNDVNSPMAEAAEFTLDVGAGPELAVAATKTYTAQLLALAMLAAALSGDHSARFEPLKLLPEALEAALATETGAERIAKTYASMTQCVTLARGVEYATAREWALKLKELSYVLADPYSAADFQHGPLALIEPGFPVFAVAPAGAVLPDLLVLLRRLREVHDARLLVITNTDEAGALGEAELRFPGGLPEWLTPVVSIVPAQLFVYHLTLAKGYDTEAPRSLSKVTLTR